MSEHGDHMGKASTDHTSTLPGGRQRDFDQEGKFSGDDDNLGFNFGILSEDERYRRYAEEREWVKEQKVDMTELKYFQVQADTIDTFAGEPTDSLETFHNEFDQLFVAANSIPDFWLIRTVRNRLRKAAKNWAVSFTEKFGVRVTLEKFWRAFIADFQVNITRVIISKSYWMNGRRKMRQ